ncbi:hypothetical protein NECAME_02693, partial [Necator americanus]
SPSQDLTRPPSADGSLSDPAPVSDPLWYTSNPHSSYTSAMMSPIMNEILSTDEGTTDDEKARLIPDRMPVTQQLFSRRQPFQQRAPRFRISMSPPRKMGEANLDPSNRRFEMRVAGSPIRERGDESAGTQTEDEGVSPRSSFRSRHRTPSPSKSTSPAKSTKSTTSRKDTTDDGSSDSTRKTAQTTYV